MHKTVYINLIPAMRIVLPIAPAKFLKPDLQPETNPDIIALCKQAGTALNARPLYVRRSYGDLKDDAGKTVPHARVIRGFTEDNETSFDIAYNANGPMPLVVAPGSGKVHREAHAVPARPRAFELADRVIFEIRDRNAKGAAPQYFSLPLEAARILYRLQNPSAAPRAH